MLVFVVEKRRFKEIQKADLIYIFNNEELFIELSKNFKCVNLNSKGIIINENFFPKRSIKDKDIYFDVKRGVYSYFKKKQHQIMRKKMVMIKGYKDAVYNVIINESKRLEKRRQYEEAKELLDGEILRNIKGVLEFEGIKIDRYFTYLNNYLFSFYRAYIYSFTTKRGVDFLGDIFRFNLLLNIMRFYHFDREDVLRVGFKKGYLRVISRLFIEQIHKNDVKNFVIQNIDHYKTLGIY